MNPIFQADIYHFSLGSFLYFKSKLLSRSSLVIIFLLFLFLHPIEFFVLHFDVVLFESFLRGFIDLS